MKHASQNRALAVLAATIFLAVAGCYNKRDGEIVMKLTPGTAPELGTAKEAGYYGLYVGTTSERELARNRLKVGDRLGFSTTAKDADNKAMAGSLFAVAGDLSVPVDPMETFEWRHVPKTEVRDVLNLP